MVTAALSGGLPGSASPHRRGCLWLAGTPNLHNRRRQFLASDSGWLWKGGVYDNVGVWALGSGWTIPDLGLRAPPASCVGQVIYGLAGRPEKGLV